MNHIYSEKKEDFQELYSKLETKLSDSIGKQVLIVENRINNYGCGGRNSLILTTSKLGVLTSQFEKLDDFGIVLPMEKYVQKVKEDSNWDLVAGSMEVSGYKILDLVREVETIFSEPSCNTGRFALSTPALYFAFGNNVEEYFRSGLPLKANGLEFEKNKELDRSYFKALELLDLKIPLNLQTIQDSIEESRRDFERVREKYV